jgi:AcrR family transcriptional regulator
VTSSAVKKGRRRASRGAGEELRGEIVEATKRLLAESASADAVSIRAVADAVGVTPPSIYLHFADKDALLSAVVVDVFAELDAAMLAAAEGVDSPMARLCAYGNAYVRFAVEHPEHYRIAAMDPCPRTDQEALDEVLADAAFTHMRDAVTACMAVGYFPAGDPVPLTLDLWTAAHGLAALMIAKPYLPWGDRETVANRVLRAAALGQAATSLVGDDPGPDDIAEWIARQRATGS